MAIVILTALLLVVTAFYAWTTHQILRANLATVAAMRDETDALNRPYVEVSPYLPEKSVIIYLRIRNTGRTAATALRLTLDRDFFQFGDATTERNIRSFTAFTNVIETLPPASQIIFALAQGFVIHGAQANDAITPKTFVVRATYSYAGGTVEETTHVDLRPFAQSVPPPDPLIDKLEEIRRAIQRPQPQHS